MPLIIEDVDTERIAEALAKTTAKPLPDAVKDALTDQLKREQRKRNAPYIRERIAAIQKRVATYPVIDPRPADELLGYDESGLPT